MRDSMRYWDTARSVGSLRVVGAGGDGGLGWSGTRVGRGRDGNCKVMLKYGYVV